MEAIVHAAGGVGNEQRLAAQQAQHPHGVGHFLVGVALVVVHPALHHGHGLAVQHAAHQAALVAGGGGRLKVGDVVIVDGDGVLHLVAQKAQAGAQDHGHLGDKALQPRPDGLGALFILLHGIGHWGCAPFFAWLSGIILHQSRGNCNKTLGLGRMGVGLGGFSPLGCIQLYFIFVPSVYR